MVLRGSPGTIFVPDLAQIRVRPEIGLEIPCPRRIFRLRHCAVPLFAQFICLILF